MIYESILIVHVIGACLSAIITLCTLFVLHKHRAGMYRACALALSGLTAFEIMSGTLLAMFSPELTAGMVCNRLAGYLVIVASVLAMLFYRMKREEMKFPKGLTLTPLSTGLASLFLAAVLGF